MGWTRDTLRSGTWLTRERIRLAAAALLVASVARLLYLPVTANGLIDRQGRPPSVYAAGTYVLDGDPRALFDPVRQYAREQRIFGDATPFSAGIIRHSFSSSPSLWH
jgi:alpha-1,2-mannosyltransferase